MMYKLDFLNVGVLERLAVRTIRTVSGEFRRSRLSNVTQRFLQLGLALRPGNLRLLKLNALFATKLGHHAEAAERWDLVRQRFPSYALAWCWSAASARVLSKIDEASALIEEASRRFPDDRDVVREAARIAERRRAYAQSVPLWQRLLSHSGEEREALQGYAYGLVQLHRFAEAEVVLERALTRFPHARALLATKGALAMAREDWDGALTIWTAFREKYPDDMAGWENLGRTLTSKHLEEVDRRDAGRGIAGPVEVARVEDEATRTLLLDFESVGEDCEFGMVQRRYGAEPLGLLRWNYVTFESLMAALALRFEGMGDPEHTELWSGGVDEYFVQDKRWGLPMHTFLSSTQVDKDVFLPKMARRVAYLKDKLVSAIAGGEKTIVFKSDGVDLDKVRALRDALRKIGPVDLLWVRTTSDGPGISRGKAGEVFKVQDNLYVGLIDRLGGAMGYWDIAFDDWISICRNMRQALRIDL